MGQYISAFQYLGYAVTHSSNWRQNATERKSSKDSFDKIFINFLFENDDFLTFKDGTNEFRDPENIAKDILHGKIRVFLRSFTCPQQTVKCDKR